MADQTDSKGSAPQADASVAPVSKAVVSKAAVSKAVPGAKPAAAPEAASKAKHTVEKAEKPVVVVAPAATTRPGRRKPAPVRSRIAQAKKVAPQKKKAPKPAPAFARTASVTELKEKIMATKTPNFAGDFTGIMNKSMTDAVAEMQAKAQEAYDKGTSMVSEMTDLAKGNVEAIVESAKIVAAGVQDLGKTYAEEAKSAYETMTADFKEMAAVKSPTELFQLQGKIMRRNFDVLVATGSKGSESAMKLANDAFAPISARVNLAVEKLSKAA